MCQFSYELGKGYIVYIREKKSKRAQIRGEGKAKSSIQNLPCCQKDTIGGKRDISVIRDSYFKGNFLCLRVLKNVFHESKSNKSLRSKLSDLMLFQSVNIELPVLFVCTERKKYEHFLFQEPSLVHAVLQGFSVSDSIWIMNQNYSQKVLTVGRCHFAGSAEVPGIITASHQSQSYWLTILVLLIAPGDMTWMLMTHSDRLTGTGTKYAPNYSWHINFMLRIRYTSCYFFLPFSFLHILVCYSLKLRQKNSYYSTSETSV